MTVSLSSITFAVGSKFGWLDKSQEQASKAWLFATRLITDNGKKTQHTHSPIPRTNFLDIWNNGGVVEMRLKNKSVFLYREPHISRGYNKPALLAPMAAQ